MKEAFKLSEKAFSKNEVPVGAVVVLHGRIIGKGYNQVDSLGDPTAHAEILAITAAANTIGDWRLNNCTIYVTKEPCSMCAGAIEQARVTEVIYGASDPTGGAFSGASEASLPASLRVVSGVLEEECQMVLTAFFTNLRSVT